MMAGRALAKTRLAAVARLVHDLPGGSFAFVMATGIVSIADGLVGFGGLGTILLAINLVAFPALSVAVLFRLVRRPSTFLSEFRDDQRGPGLLTIVAGTSVFGDQIRLLTPHQSVSAGLWLGALAIWACLIYCLFAAATLWPANLPLGGGLDGNWLLAVGGDAIARDSRDGSGQNLLGARNCCFYEPVPLSGRWSILPGYHHSFCIAGCSRR